MAGYRRGSRWPRRRQAMGIDHVWLGYHDSGLPTPRGRDGPAGHVRRRSRSRHRPSRSCASSAGSGRRCSSPTTRTAATRTPTTSAPTRSRWPRSSRRRPVGYPLRARLAVAKLYYDRTMNPRRFRPIFDALQERDPDAPRSSSWARGSSGWPTGPTSRRRTSTCRLLRRSATRRSARTPARSPPDSAFFFWPNDLLAPVWPTEDFQLVEARVPTTARDRPVRRDPSRQGTAS